MKKSVSRTWIDHVFASPPAREVKGRSRPTQRYPFVSDCCRETLYLEGGNELHAAMILEHLWRLGMVKRYKPQPFLLEILGGPSKSVPDFLVELADGRPVVAEVKAYKFLSPNAIEKLDRNKEFLASHGLPQVLWTDRDPASRLNKLNAVTSHTIRHITRGRAFDLGHAKFEEIRALAARPGTTLGDLTAPELFSWDEITCAISNNCITVNIEKALNEKSQIFTNLSHSNYSHFFIPGDVARGWWDQLPNP